MGRVRDVLGCLCMLATLASSQIQNSSVHAFFPSDGEVALRFGPAVLASFFGKLKKSCLLISRLVASSRDERALSLNQ